MVDLNLNFQKVAFLLTYQGNLLYFKWPSGRSGHKQEWQQEDGTILWHFWLSYIFFTKKEFHRNPPKRIWKRIHVTETEYPSGKFLRSDFKTFVTMWSMVILIMCTRCVSSSWQNFFLRCDISLYQWAQVKVSWNHTLIPCCDLFYTEVHISP